jgi:hypothetical protein
MMRAEARRIARNSGAAAELVLRVISPDEVVRPDPVAGIY